MEVSAARVAFAAPSHHVQDLSLAPSDHCAATPFADDQPSAGVTQDFLADENACDPASIVSPSAAASYAEAAEALAHDDSIATVFPPPVAPFAHGGGLQQGGGHAAAMQEEQRGNVSGRVGWQRAVIK